MAACLQPPTFKDKCHPFQALGRVTLIWTAVTEWQELKIPPITLTSRLQTAEDKGKKKLIKSKEEQNL